MTLLQSWTFAKAFPSIYSKICKEKNAILEL